MSVGEEARCEEVNDSDLRRCGFRISMHDLMPCPPRWMCSVLSVQVLSQLQARTARGDEASASPIQDRPAGCDAVSGRARQADRRRVQMDNSAC